MPHFVEGVVVDITSERPGLQRTQVRRGDTSSDEPAYALTDVIGPVSVGDKVVMNVTAVDLQLGTGGSHVIHWNLARKEWHEPGPGHIMKMRYTSGQVDTGVVEESSGYSPPESLDEMPVVVCLLHSQIAAVAGAIKVTSPTLRVAFVMTDQAALPLAISDLVHDMTNLGILHVTITAGQAFGGMQEAVNVMSAMGIAKGEGADVIVVGPGPGVVGSSTRLGFSGLDSVNTVAQVRFYGGSPILAIRWSDADERPRHRGLSHHSATVLDMVGDTAHVAVPENHKQRWPEPSPAVTFIEVPDMENLFRDLGLEVSSMGRTVAKDPALFEFAGAAGILAARMCR